MIARISPLASFFFFCLLALPMSAADKAATEAGDAAAATPKTFARFVPERMDDFAFENDKIAFRAYGPALRNKPENNGFDPWFKRVDYPIMDKWYKQNRNGKSYHTDHGEGFDDYKVGDSTGVGGTGIWIDGQRVGLETYTQHEILESSPERTRFKLTYEYEHAGTTYSEEKVITIELGTHLFTVDSTFYKDGEIAKNLPVCIGINTRPKTKTSSNAEVGWIATWEKNRDSAFGAAVRVSPEALKSVEIIEGKSKKADGHIFAIVHTDAQGQISYETGYGWAKAGEITSAEAWEAYLSKQ